eukprot:scaffold9758_cov99-Skeletonema_dohrnii-CCMP3373.AAC.1
MTPNPNQFTNTLFVTTAMISKNEPTRKANPYAILTAAIMTICRKQNAGSSLAQHWRADGHLNELITRQVSRLPQINCGDVSTRKRMLFTIY